MRKLLLGAALVGITFAGQAQAANIVFGQTWIVTAAQAGNAILASVPTTAPNVTFDAPSPLAFDSRFGGDRAANYTIQSFFQSGGAFNFTGTAADLGASLNETLTEITGTVSVTNGQTFTVAHDDGLSLIIGSTDLGFTPTLTSPTVSTATYTGASGNLPFVLVYGETAGAPAVLSVDLPFVSPNVPEPASLAILGLGMLGLGLVRRARG